MKDLREIKANIDLLSIIQRDTSLRKIASSGGGEWAGPCPLCPDHGEDRFRVQPSASGGGRWLCRKCTDGKWQDVINYVMRRDGVNFREALAQLGVGNTYVDLKPADHNTSPVVTSQSMISYSIWQERCLELISASEKALFDKAGTGALTYLHRRGLSDDTIKKYRIGYQPGDGNTQSGDRFDHDLNAWGITDPKLKAIYLPRGIVIPSLLKGEVFAVKIRRSVSADSKNKQKYVKIKGSRPAIFGIENLIHTDAIFTEGEFDAMLLDQAVGDQVGIATLGSAADRITNLDLAIWGPYLLHLRRIFAAYDLDEGGQKGLKALEAFSHRVFPLPLPETNGIKDVTDYWMKGGDLRAWVEQYLPSELAEQTENATNIPPQTNRESVLDINRKVIDYLNGPWSVDITRPCYACGRTNYQPYPDASGHFCATCHPPAKIVRQNDSGHYQPQSN